MDALTCYSISSATSTVPLIQAMDCAYCSDLLAGKRKLSGDTHSKANKTFWSTIAYMELGMWFTTAVFAKGALQTAHTEEPLDLEAVGKHCCNLGVCSGRAAFIFFHPEGGDALEQVTQGGCGCPIPGGIQSQAGCGSGHPGLLVGNPAHNRGVETDDHCGLFQPRPFYDSMILISALHSFSLLEVKSFISH